MFLFIGLFACLYQSSDVAFIEVKMIAPEVLPRLIVWLVFFSYGLLACVFMFVVEWTIR